MNNKGETMATKTKTKLTEEQEYQAAHEENVARARIDFAYATEAAKAIFNTDSPTDEMVTGIYARVFEWDVAARETVLEDIGEALLIAREALDGAEPSPARVFAVFDTHFREE